MKDINKSCIQSCRDAPEILYKYRSLSGENFDFTKNIFMRNELYFPHPDQINDPFDCKIPPVFKNITKEKYLAYLKQLKQKKRDKNTLDTIDLAIKGVMSNDEQTIERALRKQWEKGNLQNVGVLSLSEKPLNILMWSHYADSHRGICIGFEYDKLLFTFNGTDFEASEVTYPEFNQYPEWNYLEAPDTQQYFTKALDWEYEKEWRIVIPEIGKTKQKFDPDAMVSVYLGFEIDRKQKEDVVNWCLQRNQKPKIYQTLKSESSYSLQIKEIMY